MKKLLVCLSIALASLLTANATMQNITTETNNSVQVSERKFVGEYRFCNKNTCNEVWWNVYKDYNSYIVSVPKGGYNKHYPLIPCNELGYTHYASIEGERWYVRI